MISILRLLSKEFYLSTKLLHIYWSANRWILALTLALAGYCILWWPLMGSCFIPSTHCCAPGLHELIIYVSPVKVWANAILTLGSPEGLTVTLTARSQWAHCYHCMVSSSVDLTNSSQQAQGVSCKLKGGLTARSHCELGVSPPWVCNSCHEPAVSYLWDQPMSSPCSGNSVTTVI